MRAMIDKSTAIDGILAVMQSCWDLPADCNEGELFAYAEILFDRIQTGEDREALAAYLADVQARLDLPGSDAFREIADRSIALVRAA
jgi:hypothetical protein